MIVAAAVGGNWGKNDRCTAAPAAYASVVSAMHRLLGRMRELHAASAAHA
jgi:hypothetical protein